METDEISLELEAVKERLSRETEGDSSSFLDGLDAWLMAHPQAAPVVASPAAWLEFREKQLQRQPLPPLEPYIIHDPILKELAYIKDRLAAEAGYDIRRLVERLRKWSEAHPHTGPVVNSAEELRKYYEDQESGTLVLHEEPNEYGKNKDGDR